MATGKDRGRISVHGLGSGRIREIEPSEASAFSSLGYLGQVEIRREPSMVDVIADTGELIHRLEQSRKASGSMTLHQTGQDEIAALDGADSKIFALQYFGLATYNRFQYWSWDKVVVDPAYLLAYAQGARNLPFTFSAVYQDDLAPSIPLHYVVDTGGILSIDNMQLWLEPSRALNAGTLYVLDVSTYRRHAVLTATSMWQSSGGLYFIRFSGTSQNATLGDVLDDDAASDFAIEFWVRIQGANGTVQEIASKSDGVTGWTIKRNASNGVDVFFDDDASPATVSSATGVILQNTWTHVGVAVDRNGNAQIYINGSASGSAGAVPGGSMVNSASYLLGEADSANGQIDLGSWRHHVYGAGNLPLNIATIMANHHAAQSGTYT